LFREIIILGQNRGTIAFDRLPIITPENSYLTCDCEEYKDGFPSEAAVILVHVGPHPKASPLCQGPKFVCFFSFRTRPPNYCKEELT